MPRYEVKVWVMVDAADEREAYRKAGDILDLLPAQHADQASIEGEGAIYEIDAIYEVEASDDLPD